MDRRIFPFEQLLVFLPLFLGCILSVSEPHHIRRSCMFYLPFGDIASKVFLLQIRGCHFLLQKKVFQGLYPICDRLSAVLETWTGHIGRITRQIAVVRGYI